ncbi:uncharacterized protein Dana_GF23266 [Drosophila ananassae]|uniref:Chitin-binding type-2 domain-containing protein n=1 Tax=Drosophila ananassae TaxID=7217 RepID=B3MT03_DROAN|nr:tenascin [Drosophila ananassae]EDV30393.1 uncharacterized protein Dana_GF23266 [Drosophila ananassae]
MKLQRAWIFCHVVFISLVSLSLTEVIRDSKTCQEGFLEADPEDCGSYFQCLNEENLHLTCPEGTYFEDKNQVCVVDELKICPENAPRSCIEGLVEQDPDNCAGYLECVNGVIVKEKCPSGSYFNTVLSLCVMDENGVCANATSQCTDGAISADPDDCAGYLNCVSGRPESKKCPSGSYFEPVYKTCIIDSNGVCVQPPAICTEGEIKLDPNNCAGYLKCVDGEQIEELCPSGSYFDVKLLSCLVDTEGVCLIRSFKNLCAN